MITLRKYLYNNLLNNTNLIYSSTMGEYEDTNSFEIKVNEMYEEKHFIKLISCGDYQLLIYKIIKPNNIINMLINDKNSFLNLNPNVEIINNTFENIENKEKSFTPLKI